MTTNPKRTNRLIHETSPYLIQHAHNPVDWYPWGEEALKKARAETKPIFLSIGYSACHWCHVMERESFENEETAALLNANFINIKVDREERPDLDHIYMGAVQLMTHRGGWPMSVFLTPTLEPFYGGTYFPPEDRMGMPSFAKIITGVANAWKTKRDDVVKSANQLKEALAQLHISHGGDDSPLNVDVLDAAVERVIQNFDTDHGGFGPAPKFFHTMDLRVLLRHFQRTKDKRAATVASVTLDKMAGGGIYDQLGGGFHRYSTDVRWLAPHFEKMLYDNALLVETYLEAFLALGKADYLVVATDTLNYVLREMTSVEGGFFSTQDADSEGEEGRFYVWSKEEVAKILVDKERVDLFCKVYDISPGGNWEGTNIINRPKSIEEWSEKLGIEKDWIEDTLASCRRKLLNERNKRVWPHRDEKVLVSWNGLMIHAMALGYQISHDERFLDAAKKAADFIHGTMLLKGDADTLMHTYKDSRARLPAYLDDYAAYGNSLISLYESTFEESYLTRANDLRVSILKRFWTPSESAFYYTAIDHEKLITRPKEFHDGATPSATNMTLTFLSRLARLTDDAELTSVVEKALQQLYQPITVTPTAMGQAIAVIDFCVSDPLELVLIKGETEEEWENVLQAVRAKFLPGKIVAAQKDSKKPTALKKLFGGKSAVQGLTTLYLCRQYACQAPVAGEKAILEQMKKL